MDIRNREDINDVLRGLNWLAQEQDNEHAKIAAGALNELHYMIYETPWTTVDFEYFCDAVEIDQDKLRDAMDESL